MVGPLRKLRACVFCGVVGDDPQSGCNLPASEERAAPITSPSAVRSNGIAVRRERRGACLGSRLALRGRVESVHVGFVYVGEHHVNSRPAHYRIS